LLGDGEHTDQLVGALAGLDAHDRHEVQLARPDDQVRPGAERQRDVFIDG
jgi:hypothetical protein